MKSNPISRTSNLWIDKFIKVLSRISFLLGVIIGCCIAILYIDTNIKEEDIVNIKEKVCFVWENGLQIESDRFSLLGNNENINLYNLTNKQLNSPENAEVEFHFSINEFWITRKGNIFSVNDALNVKNIDFIFEEESVITNVYVDYVAAVMHSIFACFFAGGVSLFVGTGCGYLILLIIALIIKYKNRRKIN